MDKTVIALPPKDPRQWEKDFELALQEATELPNATIEDLIKVVLEKGILERLCPSDPEIRALREKNGHTLWPGTRTDVELYFRIFYAAQACITSIQNNWSTSFGGYAVTVAQAFGALYYDHSGKFSSQFKKDENPAIVLLQRLQNLCVAELQKKGLPYPEKILAIGTKGLYQGIPVEIEGYTFEGAIRLKPMDFKDFMAIGEIFANPLDMHKGEFKPKS